MIDLLKALLCRHTFSNWQPIRRDEIGGITLARCCAKCESRQTQFTSSASPLAD